MDFDLGYTYKYTLKKGSKVVGYAEIEWYYLGVGYLKIYKKKTDAAPCDQGELGKVLGGAYTFSGKTYTAHFSSSSGGNFTASVWEGTKSMTVTMCRD